MTKAGAEMLLVSSLSWYGIKNKVEVDVLILTSSDNRLEKLIESFPNVKLIKNKDYSLYNPMLILYLRRYCKRYDVVHAHLFPTLYWVVLANYFNKVKIVFTEHSTDNTRRKYFLLKIIDRFIYGRLNKIICISNAVFKNLIKHLGAKFKAKTSIIFNGVDVEKIVDYETATRNELGLDKEAVILVQIANFRKAKNQQVLLEALCLLPKKFNVIFIGEGPRLEILRQESKRLGVEQQVLFLGALDNPIPILKLADIKIVASNYEGFGIAAVEAMANGIPVIASNVDGLNEVVSDSGLLFDNTSQDLTACINKIIDDRSLYDLLVKRGLDRAKFFSIKNMVESNKKIYFEIV
ncbi:glycosyltransferase family 4 protein [Nonlabens xylanidelens]|nr:glycosyltransferase family 4 protein [Nonlabens xylanidelens]